MKYFVLGAIASGCFLFGTSILYGVTGTLDISEIARAASTLDRLNIHLLFALSFILVGVAFKFGAVPFHMWIPDVYQGAPTSVTLFIGSAAKVASLAMLLRVLVEGLWPLHPSWSGMLVVMSILSMAIGNIVAIAQTNLKRMLAYSTISHVGFIFLGILAGTEEGYKAAMFYAIVYAAMAAGGFGILVALDRKGYVVRIDLSLGSDRLRRLRLLAQRRQPQRHAERQDQGQPDSPADHRTSSHFRAISSRFFE